jgi:trehalose 6-phosphate phosphatase
VSELSRPGSLPEPLRALAEDPASAAVLCDFDGTLAPIVADPERAEPLAQAMSVLTELVARFAVVAVVSGRPVSFLAERLGEVGPALRLYGGYGAEWLAEGSLGRAPQLEEWAEPLAEVLAAARREAPAGLGIEDKGFALTLHWRRAPETGAWAARFAARWAKRTGLAMAPGRRAVELRAPLGVDKGTVTEQLAAGCSAACFAGDDAGDLAAFDALDRLSGRGLAAVRMAVADEESPPELLERADVVVGGPAEALAVLGALAAASAR